MVKMEDFTVREVSVKWLLLPENNKTTGFVLRFLFGSPENSNQNVLDSSSGFFKALCRTSFEIKNTVLFQLLETFHQTKEGSNLILFYYFLFLGFGFGFWFGFGCGKDESAATNEGMRVYKINNFHRSAGHP